MKNQIYAILAFNVGDTHVHDERALITKIDGNILEVLSDKALKVEKIESIDVAFVIGHSRIFFICKEAKIKKNPDGDGYIYSLTVPQAEAKVLLPNGKTITVTNDALKKIQNLLKPKKMKKTKIAEQFSEVENEL